MLYKILTGAVTGVDGYMVEAETDVSAGMTQFDIVGLPDSSIKEARERIRTAIRNSGYSFPNTRVTVNLAPASIQKGGSSFDLPIACGVLGCMAVLPDDARDCFIVGELSLDGGIRGVNGVLPMILAARDAGIKTAFVPLQNAEEAALVKGVDILPVESLGEIITHFKRNNLLPFSVDIDSLYGTEDGFSGTDFSDVRGQDNIKRALEVAASGLHNVIMIGPPGSGKTMMAKRLCGILPELSFDESLEVTKIYSVSGLLDVKNALITKLPFRSPHHTISYAALTGGGKFPKPGEISLAHKGVLFLDELTEFQKNVLEVLRQPLEEKSIVISRASGSVKYPASFMLVASMNPCPCGFFGEPGKCRCSPQIVRRYLSRVSGPLLDRIDIQVETKKVKYEELGQARSAGSSAEIRARVKRALALQRARYINDGISSNAELTPPLIDKYCALGPDSRRLLKAAFDAMGLSARAYHKIIMLARTIADMAGSADIDITHVAEAVQYRSLDRKYWG